MLCYRCGSHVPDGLDACGACGQRFSSGNLRQATGTFSRKKNPNVRVEGAPYSTGDLLCDRYLIKDVIGAGPLGFVFKAQDKEIDVEVALKVVSSRLLQTADERKAFAKEIRLARKLSHNNIVRVYEEGEDKDKPFYTMQYLDGLTLRRIVDLRREKSQTFALAEVEPIFAQIANGLDTAHKLGPHANLKPDNIIVLPDLLKITDFGLGMAVPRQPFVQAQRARGAHKYIAPEYIAEHEVDRRIDVFSMGVMLGEMLAGVFPDGSNIPELRSRTPELPPQLEGCYRRAVNENPLARYPTCGEFFADLSEIARAAEKAKPPPIKRQPMQQMQQRSQPPPPPVEPEIRADGVSGSRSGTKRPLPPPPPVAEATEALKLPLGPRKRNDGSSRPPPPPVDDANEPAFTRDPNRANGKQPAINVAAPRDGQKVRPVTVEPPRRRVGLIIVLAILGAIAGVGVGYGCLLYIRSQQPVDTVIPPPPLNHDDKQPVVVKDPIKNDVKPPPEDIKLEDPKKPDEPPKKVDVKADDREKLEKEKAEKERLAAKEKSEEERKRLEEEERKKKLNGAFPDKKDPTVAVITPPAKTGTCPITMKLVPAGAFAMGIRADDRMRGFEEKSITSTEVKAYCIDFYEYPNVPGATPMTGVAYAAAENACKS